MVSRVLMPLTASMVLLAMTLVTGCTTDAPKNDLPVICVDSPLQGKCAGSKPGFYYDYPSDTCRPFQYGACHGPMHFISRDQCEATCVARGK
jgi:hypothetical protein